MTALKITANDVIAGIPPILSEIGNAIAVVAACGNIEFITAVSRPIAFATMNTTITEQIDPTTIADKICHQYFSTYPLVYIMELQTRLLLALRKANHFSTSIIFFESKVTYF